MEEENICSICLDLLNNNKKIIEINCNHSFHYKCITEVCKYLIKNNKNCTCPICNKNIHFKINKVNKKLKNLKYFINFLEAKIEEADKINLIQNPDISLDNIIYFFNEMDRENLPKEIDSKILVFTKEYKYSFFSYNYWFSNKSYTYFLSEISDNSTIWMNKDKSKKYYDFSFNDNNKLIIFKY